MMRRSLIERQLSYKSSCYLHQFIILQIKDLAEERIKQVLQDFQPEMSKLTINVLADSAARVRVLTTLSFIAWTCTFMEGVAESHTFCGNLQ
jgi:hypothetical protein